MQEGIGHSLSGNAIACRHQVFIDLIVGKALWYTLSVVIAL